MEDREVVCANEPAGHDQRECICNSSAFLLTPEEKSILSTFCLLNSIRGSGYCRFNNNSDACKAKSNSWSTGRQHTKNRAEDRQRNNKQLQYICKVVAAAELFQGETNSTQHIAFITTPQFRPMLQTQTQCLDEWVLTEEGAWRSVQALKFRGVAALLSVSPTQRNDAQWRLIKLSDDSSKRLDGTSGQDQVADWPAVNLHAGWTLPESGVFDFSGLKGLQPWPNVDEKWSAKVFYERGEKRRQWLREHLPTSKDTEYVTFDMRELLSVDDMRFTLSFSDLERVHLESTHNPGKAIVTLITRNALLTMGVDQWPCFFY